MVYGITHLLLESSTSRRKSPIWLDRWEYKKDHCNLTRSSHQLWNGTWQEPFGITFAIHPYRISLPPRFIYPTASPYDYMSVMHRDNFISCRGNERALFRSRTQDNPAPSKDLEIVLVVIRSQSSRDQTKQEENWNILSWLFGNRIIVCDKRYGPVPGHWNTLDRKDGLGIASSSNDLLGLPRTVKLSSSFHFCSATSSSFSLAQWRLSEESKLQACIMTSSLLYYGPWTGLRRGSQDWSVNADMTICVL